MKKHDLRKVAREVRDEIHYQAVQAIRKEKRTVKDVALFYGVSRQSIHSWLNKFDNGGKQALKSGKAKGSPRCLNAEEESIIINKLKIHTPEDFKMSGMLWTREHCC
jgi:transposase